MVGKGGRILELYIMRLEWLQFLDVFLGELKITNGDYFDKVERVNLEKDSLKTMMTIRCEAIGAEEIRWSKDAQQLKSKRKSINTRILKIRLFINIDKKQQVGLAGYNCTAINGSTSVSAVKKVQFYRGTISKDFFALRPRDVLFVLRTV